MPSNLLVIDAFVVSLKFNCINPSLQNNNLKLFLKNHSKISPNVIINTGLLNNRYQYQLFRLIAILDEAKCMAEMQMMFTNCNVALISPPYL